jgi:hypothetical protein
VPFTAEGEQALRTKGGALLIFDPAARLVALELRR